MIEFLPFPLAEIDLNEGAAMLSVATPALHASRARRPAWFDGLFLLVKGSLGVIGSEIKSQLKK
jgi:hypothetical protein